MIGVIDYGIGNVGSVINMLKKIGVEAKLVKNSNDILDSDKLILPGVGSFDYGMIKLKESGLIEAIVYHSVEKKKPLLGICLGMQMLGLRSEEGTEYGLGLIPFESKKFTFRNSENLKIPHMGWNNVTFDPNSDQILNNLNGKQRYYFVHSYHAVCKNSENILMECDYGYKIGRAHV